MRLIPTAAALAMVLALSACVAQPAPAPSTPAPSATPRPASVVAAPFATRDPVTVPALRVVNYAHAGGFQGTWAYVDGDGGFDQAVDTAALGVLDALPGGPFQPGIGAGAVTSVSQPGTAVGGVRVGTAVVDAAGTMLGMRMTVTDATGAPRTLATIFTDTRTGETLDGSGLVEPEALAEVAEQVRRAEGGVTSATAASPTASPDADAHALLRDASIGPRGQLVVPDPDGANPRDSIVLDAATVTPLLSTFGRALQTAIHDQVAPVAGPSTGPSAPHVPCSIVACVALTYDDGPNPQTTPQVLDILQAEGVHGTFFEEGQNVAANPAVSRAVLAAGDVLGDHTWDHPSLPSLTIDQVHGEVERTDDAMVTAGLPPTRLFRAPYGATNDAVRAAIGKPLVHWSVDSFDWKSRDPKVFVPVVLRKIRPGGIVLMHDVYQSTVDGQRTLIDGLHHDGYTLVTVPQLFEGLPLYDGQLLACRGAYTPDTGVPCVGR